MSGTGAPPEDPYFVANFFEQAVERHGAQGTQAANLMIGTVFEYINKSGTSLDQTDLTPKKLAEVTKLVAKDELSIMNARKVVGAILEHGGNVREIVLSEGLVQVSAEDELIRLVKEVVEEHQYIVDSIKRGKVNAIGALVGEAMKRSKGQANPKRINELLQEMLLKKK
jgi:aspartyl-tRNA(Asn)/glutamyl-tRNA(Gln) amidotransferase subunit B